MMSHQLLASCNGAHLMHDELNDASKNYTSGEFGLTSEASLHKSGMTSDTSSVTTGLVTGTVTSSMAGTESSTAHSRSALPVASAPDGSHVDMEESAVGFEVKLLLST